MNEGQGQIDETRAEDEWMNRVSEGDCEKMKAARQGKFIYITRLFTKAVKVLYIMH